MANTTFKEGKNTILLYRPLKDAKTDGAKAVAFQKEHDLSSKLNVDTVKTKDGSIKIPKDIEWDLSATSVFSNGNPLIKRLRQAHLNKELIEVWEIDSEEPGTGQDSNKFEAIYLQAYISEFKRKAGDGEVNIELKFDVTGEPKQGFATLTSEQVDLAQYAFTDTVNKKNPNPPTPPAGGQG